MCTCKDKDKKPADTQQKENVKKMYKRGVKQVSMIDMASIEWMEQTSEKTNKQDSKQTSKRQTSKKTNKRWCPRGTSVGLDRMSITSLCWSMDGTLVSKTHAWTCKQACKDAHWKLEFVWKHKSLFRPPIKIMARLLLLLLNQNAETRVNVCNELILL